MTIEPRPTIKLSVSYAILFEIFSRDFSSPHRSTFIHYCKIELNWCCLNLNGLIITQSHQYLHPKRGNSENFKILSFFFFYLASLEKLKLVTFLQIFVTYRMVAVRRQFILRDELHSQNGVFSPSWYKEHQRESFGNLTLSLCKSCSIFVYQHGRLIT